MTRDCGGGRNGDLATRLAPLPGATLHSARSSSAKDWDDLVKKVRLLMAAYEILPSNSTYCGIELELMVLDNVCRKWVGDGLLYRPELR